MAGVASQDEEDRELAILFKMGSRDAYDALYSKYAPAILGILTLILKDRALAEDCMQESFCEIWNIRMQYDPSKERLFTWALKIARNKAKSFTELSAKLVDEMRLDIDLVYGMDIAAFLLQRKNLDGLSFKPGTEETSKEAVHLIYFESYSFKNAAEKLGISVESLRGKIIRVIKELKGSVSS